MAEKVSAFWYWVMAACTGLVFVILYMVAMFLTAEYWKPEAVFFAASLGGCLIGITLGWYLHKDTEPDDGK